MQGFPISEEEQKKIWEFHTAGYFPSQIAAHLSKTYAHLNGGYRSTETVKDTIKKMEQMKEIMGAQVLEPLPDLSPEAEPVPEPKKRLPDMRIRNGKRK